MKDFFKYVGATVVGLILFFVIVGIFGAMSIVGMIASGEATKSVKDNSVFVLNLSGSMSERSEASIRDQVMGQTTGFIGHDDVLKAIEKAKNNEKIKGIYIEAGMFAPDSYADCKRFAMRCSTSKRAANGLWPMPTPTCSPLITLLRWPTKFS